MLWFSPSSETIVTQDDINKLKDGTEFLYLFVRVAYHDPSGNHYINYCRVLQPPVEHIAPIWHFCEDFSDSR